MCSASRPERGAGLEEGVEEDGVMDASEGWMICALAASAAVMSGDQEKWVRIGDVAIEGHMSNNLFESPNSLFPAERKKKVR